MPHNRSFMVLRTPLQYLWDVHNSLKAPRRLVIFMGHKHHHYLLDTILSTILSLKCNPQIKYHPPILRFLHLKAESSPHSPKYHSNHINSLIPNNNLMLVGFINHLKARVR